MSTMSDEILSQDLDGFQTVQEVLGKNYRDSTLLSDAAAALEYHDSEASLVKQLHSQLSNLQVSDEVLDADSAAAAELAAVLLPGYQPGDESSGGGDDADSEGSELVAADPAVEAALQASWQRTLEELGLAPTPNSEKGAGVVGEGDAGSDDAAGAESEPDSLDAAFGWG